MYSFSPFYKGFAFFFLGARKITLIQAMAIDRQMEI